MAFLDAIVVDVFIHGLSQAQQKRNPWGDTQGTVVWTKVKRNFVAVMVELGGCEPIFSFGTRDLLEDHLCGL
jgi:hypothetical protein